MKLIKRKEVESLTTLSPASIYHLMKNGDFPQSVSLGGMSVAWVESEVLDWIKKVVNEYRSKSELQ